MGSCKPLGGRGPVAHEDEFVIRAKFGFAPLIIDKFNECSRIGERVVTQRQDNTLWPRLDLLDIRDAAQTLDLDNLEQEFNLFRQLAETVDEFCGEAVDLRARLHIGKTAIKRHARIKVGNIVLRNENRRTDIDLRGPLPVVFGTAAHGSNRFFEHLLIKLVADFADMTGLLVPQQIARAANIKIMARKRETGAERVQRL